MYIRLYPILSHLSNDQLFVEEIIPFKESK